MEISNELLTKLEALSALKVENKAQIAAQISEILNFVENLNALDLDSKDSQDSRESAELDSCESPKTPLRADIPYASDVGDLVLKNAPQGESHFFIVPKIIE